MYYLHCKFQILCNRIGCKVCSKYCPVVPVLLPFLMWDSYFITTTLNLNMPQRPTDRLRFISFPHGICHAFRCRTKANVFQSEHNATIWMKVHHSKLMHLCVFPLWFLAVCTYDIGSHHKQTFIYSKVLVSPWH